MQKVIRGKPLELILQCLTAYCVDCGYSGPRRLFAVNHQGHGYSLSSLAGGNARHLPKLMYHGIHGKVCFLALPLPAHKLRVKNNVRVFLDPATTPGRKLIAKIALPSKHRTGSLAAEIASRTILQEVPANILRTPTLARHDDKGSSWFEEELIDASDADARTKVTRFLGEVGENFYKVALESRALTATLSAIGIAEGELEAMPEFTPFSADRSISFGYVHGDLSPENMIIDERGTFSLIDWELARQAPVALDLTKIFYLDMQGTVALLDRLRHEGDASAMEQMRFAFAVELAILRRNRTARFEYLTSNRNKSPATANKMIKRQEVSLAAKILHLTPRA
jgi:hypothetical protein